MKPFALLLLATAVATGQELRLAWSPSPDPVAGYILHAGTNSFTRTNAAALRLDVGTNLTATIQVTNAAIWFFAATAYDSNRVESARCPEIMVQFLNPPAGLGVVIQHAPTITGTNWQDVGFFRLKLP